MIANFIRAHPENSINGLPFEFIINISSGCFFQILDFASLEDYCRKSVLMMGEEA